MNCDKYGRLYPERAVAPVRALLERLRGDTAWSAPAAEAQRALDALGFPPDEPLLLLRGQDELAPTAVRHYARVVGLAVGAFGGVSGKESAAAHLLEHADVMQAWQPRKLPD